jgi:hypothetical protein
METLKEIKLENIGVGENEFRITFCLQNREESVCFYEGSDMKTILFIVMKFAERIARDYLK